jgi:tRNA threonylcarbamoyl adenosine modification protein YeaZ
VQTLFLDLASHEKCIALVADEKTLGETLIDDHAREQHLLPAIEELLKKHGLSYKDLMGIASVIGPGGFMSLRVGLSLANALAWSLKIPLTGIHLSDVWSARTTHSLLPTTHSFVWLHSTKRDSLFIRGFGSLEKTWKEPQLLSLEEAQKKIPKGTAYIGELIEEHQKVLPIKKMTDVKSVAEVLPSLLKKFHFSKESLVPWYGRGA